MGTDIHALIRSFLQQRNVISLAASAPLPPAEYTKAGIVPFIHENGLRFYVGKPRGNIPKLGDPPFQLCKGTRQHYIASMGWRDIKDVTSDITDKESLLETAIREGIEELGLKLENLRQIFDMGGFAFSSATTGKEKHMWLFAAEVADKQDFLPDRAVVEATQARGWIGAQEFAIAGREDHRYIVDTIELRLKKHFKGE